MSKKLSNNGLWESSRMMLPQHKQALLTHQENQNRRERPQLDEQEWEGINSHLQRSMMESEPITLDVYDPFDKRAVRGTVVDIDMLGQRVRIRTENEEKRWIRAEDILGVIH
ncbi:YolD-like family protein [Paenibacillus dendritiformis]|uniref:YolD-like family protein n=1 Tax=Paenibacillus dendritiformis TaxID=130049 RepID=UPI001FD0A308|nr:YolD-like family protein [Paenibacillus dendritiformis]